MKRIIICLLLIIMAGSVFAEINNEELELWYKQKKESEAMEAAAAKKQADIEKYIWKHSISFELTSGHYDWKFHPNMSAGIGYDVLFWKWLGEAAINEYMILSYKYYPFNKGFLSGLFVGTGIGLQMYYKNYYIKYDYSYYSNEKTETKVGPDDGWDEIRYDEKPSFDFTIPIELGWMIKLGKLTIIPKFISYINFNTETEYWFWLTYAITW